MMRCGDSPVHHAAAGKLLRVPGHWIPARPGAQLLAAFFGYSALTGILAMFERPVSARLRVEGAVNFFAVLLLCISLP